MASGVAVPNPIATASARPSPLAAPVAAGRWDAVARWLTWGAFGLILVASALTPILRTGDAHQYYAMAIALSEQRPPALTASEVEAYKAWLLAQPADSGFASSVRAVDQPPLIVDGRQEFSHFWLYPLLAAPVIALMAQVDLHPGHAFLAVNAILLAIALWQVQRAYSAVVSLLLLASPLIWFVNKAQVEVFTFSLLCIAMAQARRGRWLWAALAAALASTQNAPILLAVACFWGVGLLRHLFGGQRQRATPGGVALVLLTIVVGALHPAYYLWRLNVLTPQQLNGGISLHAPTVEKYLAVLLDLDIGLLPWVPLTGLVALAGTLLIWRRTWVGPAYNPSATGTSPTPQWQVDAGRAAAGAGRPGSVLNLRLAALCGVVIGLGFLFVFAQTTNVNSGGTVHISRYALWLLPLSLPFLEATASWLRSYLPALLPVTAGLAVAVYGTVFQPGQPEQYVTQSPQAAFMTTWLPEWYRTVPEIFHERQHHADGGVRGSAATPSCRVILLQAGAPVAECPLSPEEAAVADHLFETGWSAAWINRPGPLGLGPGRVAGDLPQP